MEKINKELCIDEVSNYNWSWAKRSRQHKSLKSWSSNPLEFLRWLFMKFKIFFGFTYSHLIYSTIMWKKKIYIKQYCWKPYAVVPVLRSFGIFTISFTIQRMYCIQYDCVNSTSTMNIEQPFCDNKNKLWVLCTYKYVRVVLGGDLTARPEIQR